MLHRKLFPPLADRKWGSLDLDTLARIDFPGSGRSFGDNPLNDAEVCRRWVERLHEREGVEFSFGGFLEDRSHLWRGHYQEASGRFTHLGVDYNVPAGTEVFAPCPLVVHEVRADPDQDGGWGGRVISRRPGSGLFVIFAHLEHDPLPPEGEELATGARVGAVGRPEVNGGWFPHLHVQCVRGELPEDLDGYAGASTGPGEQFPDPEDSIR